MMPYRSVNGGRTSRAAACLSVVLAVSLTLVVSGCGSGPQSVAPTTITDAYESVHLTGNLPEILSTAPASLAAVAVMIAEEVPRDVPIVLPSRMPDGFGLAEPFIVIGDGTALPNPETWEGGYRVAFTDGEGLVTVAMNQSPLPGVGPWAQTGVESLGRRLDRRTDGQTTVLATRPSGDWRLAVIGIGLPRDVLERFAADLRVVP